MLKAVLFEMPFDTIPRKSGITQEPNQLLYLNAIVC